VESKNEGLGIREAGKGKAMSEIKVIVPDEALAALQMTPEQFAAEQRLAGAVKLYELGRLSSGAAARVAGIPRTLFLSRLADFDVDTFRITAEDFSQETRIG
jgi:predicted HTH domain antitoxin